MPIGKFAKDVTKEGCTVCIKLQLTADDAAIALALFYGYEMDFVVQSAAVEAASNALSISKSTRLNPVPTSTQLPFEDPENTEDTINVHSIWIAKINLSLSDVRAVSSDGYAQGFDTAAAQDKLQVSASINGTAIPLEWLGGMDLRSDGTHVLFEEPFLRLKAAGSSGGLTDRIFTSGGYQTYEGLLTFTRSLTLSQGSKAQISKDKKVTVDIRATYRDIKVDSSLTLRGVNAVSTQTVGGVANRVPLRARLNRQNNRTNAVALQSDYSLDYTAFCSTLSSTDTPVTFGEDVTTTTADDQVQIIDLNNGEPTEVSVQVLLRLSGQSVEESSGTYQLSTTTTYFEVWSEVSSSIFVTAAVRPNPPVLATKEKFGLYGASTPTDGTSLALGTHVAPGYGSSGGQTLVEDVGAETHKVTVTGEGDITFTTANRKRPTGYIDFAVLVRDEELLNGHDASDPQTRQMVEVAVVAKTAIGWPKDSDGEDKPADFIRPLTHKESLDAVSALHKFTHANEDIAIDGALIRGDFFDDNVSFNNDAGSADRVLKAYLDDNESGWANKSRLRLKPTHFRNNQTGFGMDNVEVKLVVRFRVVAAVAAGGYSSQTSGEVVSDSIFLMEEPKPYEWTSNGAVSAVGLEKGGTRVDPPGSPAGAQDIKMCFTDIAYQTGAGAVLSSDYLKDQLSEAATYGNSSLIQAQDLAAHSAGTNARRVVIAKQVINPHKRGRDDNDHTGQVRKSHFTFRDVTQSLGVGSDYHSDHSTAAFTTHIKADLTKRRGVSVDDRLPFEHLVLASDTQAEGDSIAKRANDFELEKRVIRETDSRVLVLQAVVQDLNQGRDHIDGSLPSSRAALAFTTEAVVRLLTPDSVHHIDQLTGNYPVTQFGGSLTQSASNRQMLVKLPVAKRRNKSGFSYHDETKYDTLHAGYRIDRAQIALREIHAKTQSDGSVIEHQKTVQTYDVSFDAVTGKLVPLKDSSGNEIAWTESSAQSGLLWCQDTYVGAVSTSGSLNPTATRDAKDSNQIAVGTHSGHHDIYFQVWYKKDYSHSKYSHYEKHEAGTSEYQGTSKVSNRERYHTYPVLEGAAFVEIHDQSTTHQLIAVDINSRNAVTATEANTANKDALSWNHYAPAPLPSTPVDQFTSIPNKEQDVMLIAVKKETVPNSDVAASIIDNALMVASEPLVVNSHSNWQMEPTSATQTGRGPPGSRSSSQVVTFSLAASETFVADQFVTNDVYVFVNLENSRSILCRFKDILDIANKIVITIADDILTAEERHDKAREALFDEANAAKVKIPDNQLQLETDNNAAARDSVVS